MSPFWNKVDNCRHENLSPNYYATWACEFEDIGVICGGETHCLDCGVFLSSCPCGIEAGMSGWPQARWAHLRRRTK